VRAERRSATGPDVELVAAERSYGMFSRQVILGDTLDTERIDATYRDGVLHLSIPVAERAKPRKIAISTSTDEALTTSSSSHDEASSQEQVRANA
jgi:HSP20 family protein